MLVVEKIVNFLFGLHLICFRLVWVGSKHCEEILVLPFLDIVVLGVHAMDESLNCIAFVANDKAKGVSSSTNERVWKAYTLSDLILGESSC